SWLNDTLFLLTAWNSLIGMATRPKLIVPLHTGLGMGHIVPHQARRETEAGDQNTIETGSRPSRTRPASWNAEGLTVTCWGTTRTSRLHRSSGRSGASADIPAWVMTTSTARTASAQQCEQARRTIA